MRSLLSCSPALLALLFSLTGPGLVAAADADKTTSSTPCTATSALGAFYDLRPDMAVKADDKAKHRKRGAPTVDYHARGWDYGSNFTVNVCAPVVKTPENVRGLDKGAWQNISAYYVSKGDVYSLGAATGTLTPRGRKLVLQYTGGSPCGGSGSKKRDLGSSDSSSRLEARGSVHKGASYGAYDEEDEKDGRATTARTATTAAAKTKVSEAAKEKDTDAPERRKSATISFLCDRDSTTGTAAISFVGADPDECAYFFEMRSMHACAGAEPHTPGSVGPGSVFAIILLIAVLVYLGGGIMYQRTVANQRGWRQLPNYSLWAGIWSFITDLFTIVASSCARFLPSRRGYHYVSGSPTRGRYNRDREAENRLIDQYDEEWDD